MHPNPIFRGTAEGQALAFARARGFGTLCLNGPDGLPLTALVPFVADDTEALLLHLVRSNPIARALPAEGQAARLLVSGPDGYVSPDWYGVEDQVPTWNYVAAAIDGRLTPLPADSLRDTLTRQSAFFEDRLAPKPAWTLDKMSPDALSRLMRQILPYHFGIDRIDSTWKLNQNKPEAVRLRAADQIEASTIGHETQALARIMRAPPDPQGD